MKRILIFIISIVIIICAILVSKYFASKDFSNQLKQFNLKYEKYSNLSEIKGRDIATLINQAMDDNELNKYDKNSEEINIEIKITEFEEKRIYGMNKLYKGGISKFVKYYGDIPFKCIKTEYAENGQVKYLLFEQIK